MHQDIYIIDESVEATNLDFSDEDIMMLNSSINYNVLETQEGYASDNDFRTQQPTTSELGKKLQQTGISGDIDSPSQLKRNRDEDYSEDVACTICTEEWTSSGVHQVAALRCGHVFGKSCLEAWHRSKTQRGNSGVFASCPNCSAPYKMKDIFPLYVRNIKALDISERESAIALANEARSQRDKAQRENARIAEELSRLKQQYCFVQLQLDQARKQLSEIKRDYKRLEDRFLINPESVNPENMGFTNSICRSVDTLLGLFQYDFSVTIGDKNHCSRVMAYSATRNMVLASKRFGPACFGIVVVDLQNTKLQKFYPVHQSVIRDITLIEEEDAFLVLSVGMDCSMKLSSPYSSTVLATYQLPGPGWSCCFNETTPNIMYAGTVDGQVLAFDRFLAGVSVPTSVFSFPDITREAPIHSLFYISDRHGLLGANLNGVYLWTLKGTPQCYRILCQSESDQQCYTLAYNHATGQLAASFRNPNNQTTSHYVGALSFISPTAGDVAEERPLFLDVLFQPSFVVSPTIPEHSMPKSALISCQDPSSLYFCSRDEKSEETMLWDLSKGPSLQPVRLSVKTHESIGPPLAFEFCPKNSFLAQSLIVLTASSIIFFRYHPPASDSFSMS
ncbi:RING finger and WD repeat domain-containing protein 3 [Entomophthora muscae]|uniref:RING finger and WD repeat domain-containing protein 3 n=1 Tax=Entomophthora muscae TaxID=34485 RepID=A0ACC2S3U4_9FUNG|nr:RING finger and WD repeat domain-containing protein 3 [Entomophthora muscae]